MQRDLEIPTNQWLKWSQVTNADGGVHFHRLPLVMTPWFRIYLHHFVGDDNCRDPHDHPRHFTSIGLWGSYVERRFHMGSHLDNTVFEAPWFRHFYPEHEHQLTDVENTWTLVIVGRTRRKWGFWTPDGAFFLSQDYVDMMNEKTNDND